MKIVACKNYEEMSKKAAEVIIEVVKGTKHPVLGLATGSTPEGTYKCLVEAYQAGNVDFSNVTTVNLDEYKGLDPKNEQSYRYFMNYHLFDHVNIDKARTFVPNGMELDSEKACSEYEEIIKKAGTIDVQFLGLGGNGHIGFNEPGEVFEKTTHCVDLQPGTIEANSRFFDKIEDVPVQAYSMGIKNIMSAKKIILAASGTKKAEALCASLFGAITPKVPGSILQLHNDVVVFADEEALAVIKEKGLM